MKKTMLIFMLLCALLLSGCQNQVSSKKSEVPEATDALVVYKPPYAGKWIDKAVRDFESKYDIKVTVVDYSEDPEGYVKAISEEIAADAGPDIIFPIHAGVDVEYTMMGDMFLDLSTYFENDPEFNEEDYIEAALDSGKIGGRQIIVPLNFSPNIFISSTAALSEIGFDWEKAPNIVLFMDQISSCVPIAEQNTAFSQMLQSKNKMLSQLSYSGIEFMDYSKRKACEDEEIIRELFENYKKYFATDFTDDMMIRARNLGYKYLLDREHYFHDELNIDTIFQTAAVLKNNGGYTVSALNGMDGSKRAEMLHVAAVNANSQNTLNAYNFIKLIMSFEFQNSGYIGAVPINKNAILDTAKWSRYRYSDDWSREGYTAEMLSEEEAEQIIDIICTFDKLDIPNIEVSSAIIDTMLPYFKDEADYDTCFDNLKSSLNTYLDEL